MENEEEDEKYIRAEKFKQIHS